jgi:hypothetical protein
VFPLFVGACDDSDSEAVTERQANFSESLMETVRRKIGLSWLSTGAGDLRSTFGPLDLLHYIYALFFASTYRLRYADGLLRDFPRILLPRRTDVFAELSRLGGDLAAVHLLKMNQPLTQRTKEDANWTLNGPPSVEAGFPKYDAGRIHVNRDVWLDGVAPHIWEFRIGSYQVCRKWLKDRQGRQLIEADLAVYVQILAAIAETQRCVTAIDRTIQQAGGWKATFFEATTE